MGPGAASAPCFERDLTDCTLRAQSSFRLATGFGRILHSKNTLAVIEWPGHRTGTGKIGTPGIVRRRYANRSAFDRLYNSPPRTPHTIGRVRGIAPLDRDGSYAMLKGKVAVVTGSTSGIGLGIARALAGAGADLMIDGLGDAAATRKRREETATTCGGRVAFSSADLSKQTEASGLIEEATRELGRVDVLVNNAGIQHVAPVHEFPIERWNAVIAINLTAVFLATRAVLPQMLARNWGRI